MGSTKDNVINNINSQFVSDAIIGTCRINACTPAELSLPGEYFTQNVYGSTVQYVLAVLMSSCRAGNNTKLSGGTRIEMCSDKIAGKSFLEGFECILVGFSLNELCAFVCELSKWCCYGGEIGDEPAAVVHNWLPKHLMTFGHFEWLRQSHQWDLYHLPKSYAQKMWSQEHQICTCLHWEWDQALPVLPRPCWDYDHAPVGFSQRHVVWYVSHPGAALEIVELNVGIFLGPQKHQTWAACSDTGQSVWQISWILLIARQVQSYDTPY